MEHLPWNSYRTQDLNIGDEFMIGENLFRVEGVNHDLAGSNSEVLDFAVVMSFCFGCFY